MARSTSPVWCAFFALISFFVFAVGLPDKVEAVLLATVDARAVADSEEQFSRRIYSYDMQVDSQGNLHIIYSKPLGDRTAEIFYVRRMGGAWQAPILLTSNGFRASISTFLVVGGDDRIHVSYIKDGAPESLYYRTIVNGSPTAEIHVDDGGWHSRIQLDVHGYPVFVRDNKTWPEQVSKLAFLTTQNGQTWDKSFLALPDVTAFRIANFLVENGVYHITYGDSAYIKPVLSGVGSTTYINGVFHNLHYATSQDGQGWVDSTVDSSGTLYELEFWTALALDGGRPVIAMFKYSEYGNKYASGTSTMLAKWNGCEWQKKIITSTDYPDSNEGSSVGLVVNGPDDYFGAWDFSPTYPQDDNFRGARGNIALARGGAIGGKWAEKAQVDPFSLEGAAKLCIHGGRLFFLGLGDYVDAKLYFREYDISYLGGIMPPSSTGKALPAVYFLLKK
jgi:hypothetical protein